MKKKQNELQPLHLLEDEPVPDHQRDELRLEPFARIVSGAVVGTDGPFTIGVYADWGQGKTSVLRQARSLLKAHRPEIITVWFNAWQFEREEHPIVPLVASIVKEIEARREEAERDQALAKIIGNATLENMGRLSRALRALAYGFSTNLKVKVPGFGEVETGFVAKEMIDRYEKLSAKTVDDPLLLRSLYFDAFELLGGLAERERKAGGGKDLPRIAVFIDDLDRCLPDQAVRLLESIKLVLCQPGFVFALGVDVRIIEAFLKKRYEEEYGLKDYEDGAKYLDKIVQLPLPLPPHKGRFERYITELIKRQMRPAAAETAEALSPHAGLLAVCANYTPRSLVRLINNLLVDLRLRELTAPEDKSIAADDFLGLCAVSRSLQQHLRADEYQRLIKNDALCLALAEGGRAAAIELQEALDRRERFPLGAPDADVGSRAGAGGKKEERPSLAEFARERQLGLVGLGLQSLLRSLAKMEFFDELFSQPACKLWLREHAKRRAVNEFLATQREQPPEVESTTDERQLVDRAIRQALGKKKGSVIKEDEDLSKVGRLDFSGERLTDAGLAHLKPLTSLKALSLTGTQVTDAGLAHLKPLTNLQTLYLDGTQVTDAGLAHLKPLTNLLWLYLEGTQVTDAGLAHLKPLTSLQVLYLEGTQVTDAGLAHLKPLTSLQTLSLTGTQVTDAGVKALKEHIPGCNTYQ